MYHKTLAFYFLEGIGPYVTIVLSVSRQTQAFTAVAVEENQETATFDGEEKAKCTRHKIPTRKFKA